MFESGNQGEDKSFKVIVVPFCPSCGKEVDADAVFCPNCGASLKGPRRPLPPSAQAPYRSEKAEKQEKREKDQRIEKQEKREKRESNLLGSLIGGLVLVAIGVVMSLNMMGHMQSPRDWAGFAMILGVIVIVVSILGASMARARYPRV